jgi:hypothetical protein
MLRVGLLFPVLHNCGSAIYDRAIHIEQLYSAVLKKLVAQHNACTMLTRPSNECTSGGAVKAKFSSECGMIEIETTSERLVAEETNVVYNPTHEVTVKMLKANHRKRADANGCTNGGTLPLRLEPMCLSTTKSWQEIVVSIKN